VVHLFLPIMTHSVVFTSASSSLPPRSSTAAPKLSFSNIRGVLSDKDSVLRLLDLNKPVILSLCETFLCSRHEDISDLVHPEYSIIRRDRVNRHGGGILLYVHNSVVASRCPELEDPDHELIWISLKLNSVCGKRTVFFCSAYRPPSADASIFQHLSSAVDRIFSRNKFAEVVIVGDFNCHHSKWLNSSYTDNFGTSMFTDLVVGQNLTQLVKEPTRFSSNSAPSLLDLFLTNNPEGYALRVEAPLGTSDHAVVTAELKFGRASVKKQGSRQIFLYNKANWDGLMAYFRRKRLSKLLRNQSVDAACNLLTETIMAGVQRFVPSKSVKNKHTSSPWFNDDCSNAFLRKKEAFLAMQTNPDPDRKVAYQAAKKCYQHAISDAKAAYAQQLGDRMKTSSNKEWWKLLKRSIPGTTKSSVPQLEVDGSIVSESAEKANAFNAFFAAQCNYDAGDNSPTQSSLRPELSLCDIKFSRQLVLRTLKSLDTTKATGPDHISPIVLRKCASQLAFPLAYLFQLSFNSGVFPTSWKFANVTPVHKKGSKSEPSNYRPISILPVMSKVMEMVVNEQLREYLEVNQLLCPTQYGFRKNRSTVDVLSVLSQSWQNALNSGKEVIAITLDISKAFDRVWHAGLIAKLPSFGIGGRLLNFVSDFLSGRTQSVVLDGQSSNNLSINAGVPQGSVLGPTLFLLFIDDMRMNLDNNLHLFADDATLHAQINDSLDAQTTCDSLQADLHKIEEWSKRWCVSFNPSKCESFVLSRKRQPFNPCLNFCGARLSNVTSIKLLGITFTSDLNWNTHIQSIAKRASRILGMLRRAQWLLPKSGKVVAYKAFVRPLMEYASPVWNGGTTTALRLLDIVQNRAISAFGISDPVDCRIQFLSHRRKVAGLCVFYKFFNQPASSELRSLLPELSCPTRCTRHACAAHHLSLEVPKSRTDSHLRSFVPLFCRLWNDLPQSIFPDDFKMQRFKLGVNSFLSTLPQE